MPWYGPRKPDARATRALRIGLRWTSPQRGEPSPRRLARIALDHETSPVFDALLAERPFVRHVTRRLAGRDAHAAEDLEQEVWAAALKNPPRDARSVRGWLRQVARSQLVERLRGRGRAALAEERAARVEATESAEDRVARRDACEHLARALRALEEPYRSVVVLRFVEELPPREVARRLGRPVETVRTQTRRALATLRERLEREHGVRRVSALMGLLLMIPAERSTVATSTWIAAAGLIAAGTLTWVAWRTDAMPPALGRAAPALARARSGAGLDATRSGALPLAPEEVAGRTALAGQAPGSAPSGGATVARTARDGSRSVDVVALDGFSQPIAGASVWSHVSGARRLRGRTDARGRLSVPVEPEDLLGQDGSWILPDDGVEVSLEAPGHVTRSVVVLLPEEGRVAVPLTLQGPAHALDGLVLGPDGRSLPGVRVVLAPAEGMGTRQAVEGTTRAIGVVRHAATRSDAAGRFRIEGARPGSAFAMAWAPGHAIAIVQVDLDGSPGDLLSLQLEREAPLRGITLGQDGETWSGVDVDVRLGRSDAPGRVPLPPEWHRTRSDERGRFQLPRPSAGSLAWTARGRSPGHVGPFTGSGELELEPGVEAQVTVRLAAPTLGVSLLVVDGSGAPLSGLYAVLRDTSESRVQASSVTDERGRAWLQAADLRPHAVDVFPARSSGALPWASRSEVSVEPGAGELRVVLAGFPHATARVLGSLPAAGLSGRSSLRVQHVESGNFHSWPIDLGTGAVAVADLPPGRYRFELETDSGGTRGLGERTLHAGETVHLEELTPVDR